MFILLLFIAALGLFTNDVCSQAPRQRKTCPQIMNCLQHLRKLNVTEMMDTFKKMNLDQAVSLNDDEIRLSQIPRRTLSDLEFNLEKYCKIFTDFNRCLGVPISDCMDFEQLVDLINNFSPKMMEGSTAYLPPHAIREQDVQWGVALTTDLCQRIVEEDVSSHLGCLHNAIESDEQARIKLIDFIKGADITKTSCKLFNCDFVDRFRMALVRLSFEKCGMDAADFTFWMTDVALAKFAEEWNGIHGVCNKHSSVTDMRAFWLANDVSMASTNVQSVCLEEVTKPTTPAHDSFELEFNPGKSDFEKYDRHGAHRSAGSNDLNSFCPAIASALVLLAIAL